MLVNSMFFFSDSDSKVFTNKVSKTRNCMVNRANGRKCAKLVENTVGKGEISRYEQVLLFAQTFQKTCIGDRQIPWLVWERANRRHNILLIYILHEIARHASKTGGIICLLAALYKQHNYIIVLSVASTMVERESSKWRGKNIVRSPG